MDTLENVVCHHGIKGQKWGVRRYQNQDGSLTELGKKRQTKQDRKEQTKKEKQEWKERTKSYKDMKIFNEQLTYHERSTKGKGYDEVKQTRVFDRLIRSGMPPEWAYEVAYAGMLYSGNSEGRMSEIDVKMSPKKSRT